MINHIDYSQYKMWQFCRWAWYERYVLKRRKKWPQAMRDDALAVGSLVHDGLEGWYKNGTTDITEEVITKINPTPEALRLCKGLVFGYVQTYPREAWDLIRCEQPVRFALIPGRDGLAKIDLYFYIDNELRVESGVPGYQITLKPGWWIQEYKTKSSSTSFAEWMMHWTTNMQADFQMLALQEKFGSQVNGLLVNVIEKPNIYIPKRKCKECDQYWNYGAWQPGESGLFVCPNGHSQKLKPIDMQKEQPQGSYFRMVVERTPEQLANSHYWIYQTAQQMEDMEQYSAGAVESPLVNVVGDGHPPDHEHCMNLGARYARECEFFRPHTYGISTINNPEYEETEDYINEPRMA